MFVHFPHIYDPANTFRKISMQAAYAGRDENGDPIYDGTRPKPKMTFTGHVKVHGTNAAIRFEPDGSIVCQQRNGDVPPDEGHMGFKAFVNGLPAEELQQLLVSAIDALRDQGLTGDLSPITIFGEWFGAGIIRGNTAVNQTTFKRFYIFGVCTGGSGDDAQTDTRIWAKDISKVRCVNNFVLNAADFSVGSIEVDFKSDASAAETVVHMAEATSKVEEHCPVGASLGLVGTGEGVVWTAFLHDKQYLCKTKGAKHAKTRVRVLDPVAEAKKSATARLAEDLVTEERVNQAIDSLGEGVTPTREHTSVVCRWVVADVLREEVVRISDAAVEERSFNAALGRAASRLFLSLLEEGE